MPRRSLPPAGALIVFGSANVNISQLKLFTVLIITR